jgi:ribonuclease HII
MRQCGFDFPSVAQVVAGVDEVGRGPLAGPVVSAAVILDPGRPIAGLRDSKALSASRREALAQQIRERAVAWALGRAEVEEIDRLNILRASLLSMQRAVAALACSPGLVLVDGNHCPPFACPALAVVKGDASVAAISAASIVAKVSRDQEMIELDALYPGYGLARHKGYPSQEHLQALDALGVTPLHRRSYAPVQRLLGARGGAR